MVLSTASNFLGPKIVGLRREAVRVLLRNWHGHATVPSRSLYPHQWSWDSAFIALGLQHISAGRAATEMLSLFGAQWADGRIPQIAFNPAVPADLSLFDTYTRRDVAHAGAGERPTDQDYARYIRLMLKYRDHGYDDDWVRAKAEFLVVDPAFNALWAWSELALAEVARRLGRDEAPHLAEAARITAAMVDRLWSEDHRQFLARDERSGRQLPDRTVAGLIPLVLPGLPAEVAAALVGTATGEAFRIGAADVHGVPSFDLTDVRHEPRRYWRGPTWLNTTWLVARGLEVHGHKELAERLDDDLVGLVAKSGFREYFHPLTGRGHGTRSFSWSAALLIHVLAESD
jgi:glycogen debranching enzyme